MGQSASSEANPSCKGQGGSHSTSILGKAMQLSPVVDLFKLVRLCLQPSHIWYRSVMFLTSLALGLEKQMRLGLDDCFGEES